MRNILSIVFLCLLLPSPVSSEVLSATGTVEVYFSPNGGATDAIIREVGSAKLDVLVQAYSFTSKTIAKALLDAKKRGVKVEVILDKSQRRKSYGPADFLSHAGIPTYIDGKDGIAHNKVIIIDRQTLVTGSFNFTAAAEERNAENVLVLKGNPALIQRYLRNFDEHRAHSDVYRQ